MGRYIRFTAGAVMVLYQESGRASKEMRTILESAKT
jgi:hypothetical protein